MKKTDFNRPWEAAAQLYVHFFDIHSMHQLRELFAISEILYSFQPDRIVEYGTAMGGLTALFGRWAFANEAEVLSIDNGCYSHMGSCLYMKDVLKTLPVELLDMNEYKQECYEKVQDYSKDHRTLFYCDGGNKPLELKTCARILKPEDLLVCHDYDMTFENLKAATLPPLLMEVAHITKEQAQVVIEKEDLVRMFEPEIGDDEEGKRRTRLLALRRRPKENNDDSDSVSSKESCREAAPCV